MCPELRHILIIFQMTEEMKNLNGGFGLVLCDRPNVTSLQDFLDFDVVCAEAAVVLEVVGVVQKRSSQREEEFLKAKRERILIKRQTASEIH